VFFPVTAASATIYQSIPVIRVPGPVIIDLEADVKVSGIEFQNDVLSIDPRVSILIPDQAQAPTGLAAERCQITMDVITPSGIQIGLDRQVFIDVLSLENRGGPGTIGLITGDSVVRSFLRMAGRLTVDGLTTGNIMLAITFAMFTMLGGAPIDNLRAFSGGDFRDASTQTIFPFTPRGSLPPGPVVIREMRASICPVAVRHPSDPTL